MKVTIHCLGDVTYTWEDMPAADVAGMLEAFENCEPGVMIATMDDTASLHIATQHIVSIEVEDAERVEGQHAQGSPAG